MPKLYGGVFGVRFDRQHTIVVVFKNSLRQIFRVSNIESARRFTAQDVREKGNCGENWWAWVDLNHQPRPYQYCGRRPPT